MLNTVGIVFLILILINFLLETTLTFLNLRHLKQKAGHLPSVLRDRIDLETCNKSNRYNSDSGRFGILETVVSLLLIIYFVYFGGFERIDTLARNVDPEGYYVPALIFGASIFLIKLLIDVPFNIYTAFVIEERYGFNKTTPGLYATDFIKSLILSAFIGIPIYVGMLWFMAKAGDYWWLWCWCFIETIQALLLIIFPVWIAPLFNKFTPIEEGELKEKILSLSKKVGFPSQGIFIMDGSKRSQHSNAYFTGLGKKKRIVLFDTLVQQMKLPQILAVLAHEFGHFKLHHIKKIFIINSIVFLVSLYCLSHLFRLEIFYHGFGFSHSSNYAALVILGLSVSPLSFIVTPLFSMLSRRFEYKADEFAIKNLERPQAMPEVIAILTRENLMNINPHPWYSFFHYSHPTPVERINSIKKLLKN